MAPAEKGEVEATLENDAVERLEEYLRRGRRLQPLWKVDLIDGWVSMVNQWADGSTEWVHPGINEEGETRRQGDKERYQ